MSKYHLGMSRAFKGWVIQEVFQGEGAGMKRSCWRATKNGVIVFEDTLAELKSRIREEEYQYEEEEP
jgi:hypothetical protein